MGKTGSGDIPAWLKLDNAAKIYPPSRTRGWAAMFRLSVTLTEPIDPKLLAKAQKTVLGRLPTFGYRLRRGFFWYYLERLEGEPELQQDVGNPLVRMDLRENGRFLYRVRYHGRRIAVEFFHALTDGTGALSFLTTLAAEYLRLKEGVRIPAGGPVLDCRDAPSPEEMEDSFLRHARGAGRSRRERPAYHVTARRTAAISEHHHGPDSLQGRCGEGQILWGQRHGVLTAVLVLCYQQIQSRGVRPAQKRLPIKVMLPVNLRRFYGSKTLRNFASYLTWA